MLNIYIYIIYICVCTCIRVRASESLAGVTDSNHKIPMGSIPPIGKNAGVQEEFEAQGLKHVHFEGPCGD